jgi:uncharacterized protein YabN with tetrapyrrole methylase and pyrophosphatase domain
MAKKLLITGSGIKSLSHFTKETEAAIAQANYVLYLVNEPITAQWIANKSQKSESLDALYFAEKQRVDAYKNIVDRVLFALDLYQNVCLVVYGHPLLLSNTVSDLINRTDTSGVQVTVLPAISAFDCLLADLAIDPMSGCFSIEASVFLHQQAGINTRYHLILWQVGLLGDHDTYSTQEKLITLGSVDNSDASVPRLVSEKGINGQQTLKCLKEKLIQLYSQDHGCVFYEASLYPHIPPKMINLPLKDLEQPMVSRLTTIYIPPLCELC